MIKFFRHVRQSLVMENKTGKYFKYAIGEIILVVIGILIALQINNWNEHEKNRRTEIIFLNGILNDIGEQKQLIKEQQNWESNKLKEAFSCLDIIKTNTLQSNIDSLYFIMERLNPRKTFSVFNPTFEEIKSTGSFKKCNGSLVLPNTPINAPTINMIPLIAIIFSKALKVLNLYLRSLTVFIINSNGIYLIRSFSKNTLIKIR